MRSLKFSLVIVCIALHTGLWAQTAHFFKTGNIEFEKSVNTHAIIRNEEKYGDQMIISQQQLQSYKKEFPQFKLLHSALNFTDNHSIYKPFQISEASNALSSHPALLQNNIVYTDLIKKNNVIKKNILDETFLVKDSVRKISWKITSEMREISGYMCRRANAVIMDSIYVVAFYTDLILPEGGPESFNGLPGMILGIALPHENITWFAKKVSVDTIADQIEPPIQGKLITNIQLRHTIEASPVFPRMRHLIKFLLL